MAAIDVSVDIEITAAPADVAAVMFDPARDQEWIKAVTGVEIIDPALAPGARVLRRGTFMGREFSWTSKVETVHFPHLLSVQVAEGPFAGTISYQIQRSGAGSHVRIKSVGQVSGLGFLPSSLITGPMKS